METGNGKRVRDSLCFQPSDLTRSYHLLVDSTRVIAVREEINRVVDEAEGTFIDRAHLNGAVYAQLRRAAAGKLRSGAEDGEVLEPVRRHPELWEIKWKRQKQGEFRMYHAEPGGSPALVGLRFHRKVTTGTADEIERRQDAEMDLAAKRYTDGSACNWGHASTCQDCVTA